MVSGRCLLHLSAGRLHRLLRLFLPDERGGILPQGPHSLPPCGLGKLHLNLAKFQRFQTLCFFLLCFFCSTNTSKNMKNTTRSILISRRSQFSFNFHDTLDLIRTESPEPRFRTRRSCRRPSRITAACSPSAIPPARYALKPPGEIRLNERMLKSTKAKE